MSFPLTYARSPNSPRHVTVSCLSPIVSSGFVFCLHMSTSVLCLACARDKYRGLFADALNGHGPVATSTTVTELLEPIFQRAHAAGEHGIAKVAKSSFCENCAVRIFATSIPGSRAEHDVCVLFARAWPGMSHHFPWRLTRLTSRTSFVCLCARCPSSQAMESNVTPSRPARARASSSATRAGPPTRTTGSRTVRWRRPASLARARAARARAAEIG